MGDLLPMNSPGIYVFVTTKVHFVKGFNKLTRNIHLEFSRKGADKREDRERCSSVGCVFKRRGEWIVLKRRGFWFLPLLLILLLSGTVFAQEFKEFTVFTGEPLPDYPGSTIVGDIIERETGVKLIREALVGDLETKVGLMIASGDYPDLVVAAHFTSLLKDAGHCSPQRFD